MAIKSYTTRDGRTVEYNDTTSYAGYAAPCGTGPDGETCRTCRHAVRHSYGKVFYKCDLMRPVWTHGPKTDIKIRAAACRKWAAKEGTT